MNAIRFCERESDLAPMTIFRMEDGRLIARKRSPTDAITHDNAPAEFGDAWIHTKSQGRYTRNDQVFDEDLAINSYHYTSQDNGREWLRAISSWHEILDNHTRFERLT